MKNFEQMFKQEKMPIAEFLVEVINQLADEQDFDIEYDVKKRNVLFHIMGIHRAENPTRTIPTEEEIETFLGVAIGRMRDLYPDYNWTEGLRKDIESEGTFFIHFDEDKLGITK